MDSSAAAGAAAVKRSALAALMTTDPAWGERWMAAELSDALRTLDRVCDAPADEGWTPRTFGHAEGDEDPFFALFGGGGGNGGGGGGDGALASSMAAGGRGEGHMDDDDGGAAGVPPAAEAAMEAVRRSTAHALALPAAAMTHDAQARDERNGEGLSARVSYLANVAAAIADDFLTRLRRRVAANDAFGALAVGSGRSGAARVGACVAGATHLSRALADHGEDAGLLAIGADLFEEQCSALDEFATQWVAALADSAVGAFSAAAGVRRYCPPRHRHAFINPRVWS